MVACCAEHKLWPASDTFWLMRGRPLGILSIEEWFYLNLIFPVFLAAVVASMIRRRAASAWIGGLLFIAVITAFVRCSETRNIGAKTFVALSPFA